MDQHARRESLLRYREAVRLLEASILEHLRMETRGVEGRPGSQGTLRHGHRKRSAELERHTGSMKIACCLIVIDCVHASRRRGVIARDLVCKACERD